MAVISKEEKRLRFENFKLTNENRKLKIMLVHMQFALKESARKASATKGAQVFVEMEATRAKLRQISMGG